MRPAARTAAASPSAVATPAAAPKPPPADSLLETARYRPIVFREIYPPPADPGLSFYGGAPVAPAGFAWPRADAGPLHFVMQWNCAELARLDPTGLLPREGALYLFCDLAWRAGLPFRFVHAAGPATGWTALAPPPDLGPLYGEEGAHCCPYASPHLPKAERGAPNLLPRWPFTPLVIDYPRVVHDDEDEDDGTGRIYWTERSGVGEALLAAQNSADSTPVEAVGPRPGGVARPFQAFPHDYAAARVVCAKAIEALRRPQYLSAYTFLPELDAEARLATAKLWLDEATAQFRAAARHPVRAAMTQAEADRLWSWIEKVAPTFDYGFPDLVETCVNVSLGIGSEGVGALPADFVARNARRHRLASETTRAEYEHEFIARSGLPREEAQKLWREKSEAKTLIEVRDVHAPTPNHMFGPPSYVQGDVEELIDDRLLLLELSTTQPIGFELGEGVLQFLIRPDDLRAGRFDRVELVQTGY